MRKGKGLREVAGWQAAAFLLWKMRARGRCREAMLSWVTSAFLEQGRTQLGSQEISELTLALP